MSITFTSGFTSATLPVAFDETEPIDDQSFEQFSYTPTGDVFNLFVSEFADDGSQDDAYLGAGIFSASVSAGSGSGTLTLKERMDSSFFETHVGATITFEIVLDAVNPNTQSLDAIAVFKDNFKLLPDDDGNPFNSPTAIQQDHLGITRLELPLDQATTENQAILDKTTTERMFVDGLLSQVQNTTIPAVAVEGSMYGAVGTSDEITALATGFLPPQIANATLNGLNPQVYACEALGLAFAFADENQGTAFDDKFGPLNPATPATPAGDASFATLAATAIFGSAATANTPGAIQQFVSNWEAFYTSHGIPGDPNATHNEIVLAARGAAWGDAVGVALANALGPLPGQVINFLEDAARGSALYSKSLVSQPTHQPFQGGVAEFLTTGSASAEPVGLAAADHLMI
jgi:hypothetical protein